nr:hypothetical protein GTC16762_32430 [Pigmentibacter ruber]
MNCVKNSKLQENLNYFTDHFLIVESDIHFVKSFLCRREKTTSYAFRVIFSQNYITIYGDIGNLCFSNINHDLNDKDPLNWLLSINKSNIDYLMSKVPLVFKSAVFEFSTNKALEKLRELELDLENEIKEEKEFDEDFDYYEDKMFFQRENEKIKEYEDKIKKIRVLKKDLIDLSEFEFVQRYINDLNFTSFTEGDIFKDYTSNAYITAAALFKFCELYIDYKNNKIQFQKNIANKQA